MHKEQSIFFSRKLWLSFFVFIALNIILYGFILFFAPKVAFDTYDYKANAHHYIPDPRIKKESFNLYFALGQYDAQWYLKIAEKGYPKNPTVISMERKDVMDGLSFAFFPFYPVMLFVFNLIFHNIQFTAFVLANMLLLGNFFSFYAVIAKLYSRQVALKTIFLLLFFPLSIFFRSYFTEGLFLLILIWFSYFFVKKKWIISSVLLSFLPVINGRGLFILIPFFYFLGKDVYAHKISFKKATVSTLIVFSPFFVWAYYCFYKTGNFLYFLTIRSSWNNVSQSALWMYKLPIIQNIAQLFLFPLLPFHYFHNSQVDVTTIVIIFSLLLLSKKFLHPKLWSISAVLWGITLLATDTMSFSRYQIVSFPLFIFLAHKLKKWQFIIVAAIFYIGLLATSLFFVNWYWVG